MPSVLADTHTVVWFLSSSTQLSGAARGALRAAAAVGDPIYVASVSLVELRYLVERGRLPEHAFVQLVATCIDPNNALTLAPLDLAVAEAIGRVPRNLVPDMPDRIIAATALALDVPLVTRDQKLRSAPLVTIW